MNYQFTNIDRVLAKFSRDFRGIEINETDAIEWIGEALGFMEVAPALESHVAFMQVKNYQCPIPQNLKFVTQIAKNLTGIKEVCSSDATTVEDNVVDNGGAFQPVAVDCQGNIVGDYDVGYYRPYYDQVYEYGLWTSSTFYKEAYVPVRLANHSFFNSLVCKEECYDDIYKTSNYEYTIVSNQFRFSFEEGVVAISYLKHPTDDDGYPMIPDDIRCETAINYYLSWKVFERMEFLQKQGAANLAAKAEQRWLKYCNQFNNSALMPKGEEDYQQLMEQSRYLIPRFNRYYGFFGNLANKELRKFNDPDNRSRRFYT